MMLQRPVRVKFCCDLWELARVMETVAIEPSGEGR